MNGEKEGSGQKRQDIWGAIGQENLNLGDDSWQLGSNVTLWGSKEAEGKERKEKEGPRFSVCEPVVHLLFNRDFPSVGAIVGIVQKGFLLI